jgi:glycosyltransferase involved in cell wall biosynthesis
MAHGLPIVATPVGGIPEVVRDGREGLLGGGPEALADRILAIAREPGLGERLGRAGRERAEEFRMDHLAGRVADLYARLRVAA